MIHGPCGNLNTAAPCMIDGKCSKSYPRNLTAETITGNDGYPLYRRRSKDDNGFTTKLRLRGEEIEIDNRWIVPYSPILSKTYKAHINVEYCNSVKSIKYICKNIHKGSDMAVFGAVAENSNDETTQYQMGRYPTVLHFAVHLENGQRVYFTENIAAQRATQPPATTLTAFFNLCRSDDFARTLLYSEAPKYYTWNHASKSFQRRKQGTPVETHHNVFASDAIGRIYTIHPTNAECFYLRLLLINVRGPLSFQNIRTVNGQICTTFREACMKLHLLEDDTHWNDTLTDSAASSTPFQIRTLFAIIISTRFPASPGELRNNHKNSMTEDILYRIRIATGNHNLDYTSNMYNEELILVEDLCLSIANKALT
ncbi:uncharacterized protein LOC129250420 [Anastrepha obliqua]|uniref:uncharacterized protein LOC129250420 n=1 Tax=Anastrepha obliqua TaxID=95512 RepID=UPI002409F9C3|nr:uncharacterized protein LOC129250420 [Anastrepha obliqua]